MMVKWVSLSIGRKRLEYDLDLRMFGIEAKTNEQKLFFEEHVKPGKVTIIPQSKERALNSFDMKVRNSLYRASVEYDFNGKVHYMTEKTLKDYLEVYKKYEKEYYEHLEEIAENYNKFVDNFISLFEKSFTCSKMKKELVFKMKANIPDLDSYIDSFYISLIHRDFLLLEKDDIYKVFGAKSLACATSALDKIESCIKSYDAKIKAGEVPPTKNAIANKTLGSIKKSMLLINEHNLLNDERFDDIIQCIKKIESFGGIGKNSKYYLKKCKDIVNSVSIEYELK